MSAASTTLLVVGILAVIAGAVLVALDYIGVGDTSGLDYKDVWIIVVGIVLAGIGGALAGRKKPAAPPQ